MAAESALYAERLRADTCGWRNCYECAAVRRFVARWNAGQVQPRPAITSAWWESPAADALYRRGVKIRPNPKGQPHA